MIRRSASLLAVLALLFLSVSVSAAAAAKTDATTQIVPDPTVKIEVGHLHGGRADIYDTVPVTGTIVPFAPGQRVEITFYLNGHRLVSHKVAVSKGAGNSGIFNSSVIVREDGKYAVSAHHAATAVLGADSTVRKSWRVSFPALHPGECTDVVEGFKKAMAKMGYVSGGGSCFNGRLGREVLAYRKVNDMNRSQKAGAGLVKSVFGGKGGYHVKYPSAGEHAEVPLGKQVLVLSKGDKPFAIYPVSTGKPSTPTITGHYTFYRQEPGYNSEGMYYSFYWHNGYAVHGYAEVPNYAASHGCVRTFIADQPRIYEQLHYGESIFVF
ncbi:MAG TPA: L,D-transpeptidase [Solirubrobacterales bacterium]|nr:L,D-transpeptidase [Solirubrobacterales bacterium]